MNWLNHLSLAKKLTFAFSLCALITLGVGGVGKSGLDKLSDLLDSVLNNNLASVDLVNEVKANVIAHNRDLYWIMTLAYRNASQDERNVAIASMQANKGDLEKPFAAYRATPLQDDERVASENFERNWKAYTTNADAMSARIQADDVEGAYRILEEQAFPSYRNAVSDLQVIVDSNSRQGKEAGAAAVASHESARWTLLCGTVLALLSALVLAVVMTRLITRPIYQAVASAEQVAKGDLTQTIASERRDEMGQLLRALGSMQQSLKGTVQQMAGASSQLAAAAEELQAVTEEGSRGLVRQHDEVQQAATAVNEMTAAVEEVARNAASTSEASRQTSQAAQGGRAQVQQAVQAMTVMTSEIGASTEKVRTLEGHIRDIGQVLEVIRGIAEQTNLLALNAAIEAARAGEQGRGFAVVADEVRALAHRTQGSTGEIEQMMSTVRSGAEEAVAAMYKSKSLADDTQQRANQAGVALDRIAEGVELINERNLVIASAAEEQAQVAREVDRNLVNIQDLSTQTATGAQQTAASSQELSRLATSFNSLVAQFRY